ncbi:MAG: xanthine dehydrogenase family protein subunit M [bacterium]|nr:xanthine dehydrogenase family protein subunit M [bacterium]
MREIETVAARTLDEALDVLARRGDGIRVIAGGTDVIVQELERRKEARALLSIGGIGALRSITEDGGRVRIGALVTHREIERSPVIRRRAPLLREAAFIVGSPQIKNLATIGGNIANASPVADSVPALMALEATITLASRRGERRVPVAEFATGPGRTVRRPDELITEVSFDALPPDSVSFYERLGQRRLLSISKVGVAFRARLRDGRFAGVAVALGAVAPTVIMAPRTAAALEGERYSPEVAGRAARAAEEESRAITDLRSTSDYRNRMAGALLVRGLARVMEGRG